MSTHTTLLSTKPHAEKAKQIDPYFKYISDKKQGETAPHVLTASSSLMSIYFVVLTP